MTEFNGYKLKPADYKFQVGDILVKVIGKRIGDLALVTSASVAVSKISNVELTDYAVATQYWRAIETLPGSQAKAGDTVYCISNTGGSCNQHDLFKVKSVGTDAIYPEPGQRLLRAKTTTEDGWSWYKSHFVVLVKAGQPKYELDLPRKIYLGWYVYAGNSYYLRQDLTVQEGARVGTSNTGYWPTEAEALAARAKYLGEQMKPNWKDLYHQGVELEFKHIDSLHWKPILCSAKASDRVFRIKEPEIKVGSHWERLDKQYSKSTPIGEIIKVTSFDSKSQWVKWSNYRNDSYSTTEQVFRECFRSKI